MVEICLAWKSHNPTFPDFVGDSPKICQEYILTKRFQVGVSVRSDLLLPRILDFQSNSEKLSIENTGVAPVAETGWEG